MDTDIALEYIITDVFCPLRLPGVDDHTFPNDHALIKAVLDAAQAYTRVVADAAQSEWPHIEKMLENLGATVQSARLDKSRVVSQLSRMQPGGMRSSFDIPIVIADDPNHVQMSSRFSSALKTPRSCLKSKGMSRCMQPLRCPLRRTV